MLTQPTLERLRAMKLTGMADGYLHQQQRPDIAELSFEERLGLLVDQEWTYRQNRRLQRLLKEAKLRMPACVEDIDYQQPRGLDRGQMRSLATCQWIRHHQVVIVTGPTGTGKTYLACALAHAACREGLSARYWRLPRLMQELAIARGDGSYGKLLGRIARIQLLVIDDWGLQPLDAAAARDLLEVLDERVQQRATLIASQLPLEEWYAAITDATLADAILDRLVHHAHTITLKGESMRKVKASAGSVKDEQ